MTEREQLGTRGGAFPADVGLMVRKAGGEVDVVTSRWLVEFLDTVRVSFCDYAAASSGIATSSASTCRSFMECSLK